MDRAYHPSEIIAQELKVDEDYYFKQQLIPVLSRLLDPIDGIDDQMIAECFGLDPKDFKVFFNFNKKKSRIPEFCRFPESCWLLEFLKSFFSQKRQNVLELNVMPKMFLLQWPKKRIS